MTSHPPQELCCPITEELYEDPVLLIETGQTYDRQSIERWFKEGHNTCPSTGKTLTSKQIVPNFAVRGLVDAWRQAHMPSTGAPMENGSSKQYPEIFSGSPQDRAGQLSTALSHIKSPSMQVAAYRNGSTYQLWQIHTLAKEPDCQKSLLEEDAISTLVPLLADEQLAVGSASILQRLATMDGADRVMQAGGIDRMVALLSASSGKTREAAAMALYYMGMASPAFCSETFTSLCNTMLHARGEAAVLAALDLLYTGGASEGLAATYLTNVLVSGPGQQWRDYFVCRGTSALTCLLQQLTAAEASSPGTFAASRALAGLAANQANQGDAIKGLVAALQRGEDAGKQRVALLLWEMLHVPAAGSTNTVVASQCASSETLVPGISWALHAGSSAAAGVMQALVHDNHRVTNSVTQDVDTDSIRLRLIVPEANVIPQLTSLLHSTDALSNAAAAHALANMTAFRSGSCQACSNRKPGGAGFLAIPHLRHSSGGGACHHRPQGLVAASSAPASLLGLMNASRDALTVSACIAALNNLCTSEEGSDRVYEEAKRYAPHGLEGVTQRLLQLISWKQIPKRIQDAARNILLRMEGRHKNLPPISLITLLLMPPTQLPAFPEP